MNEPANFVPGSVSGCSKNKWDYPPYKPSETIIFTLFILIKCEFTAHCQFLVVCPAMETFDLNRGEKPDIKEKQSFFISKWKTYEAPKIKCNPNGRSYFSSKCIWLEGFTRTFCKWIHKTSYLWTAFENLCREISNKYNRSLFSLAGIVGNIMADKTVCMNAKQGDNLHYDVHSLYGWSQTLVTLE